MQVIKERHCPRDIPRVNILEYLGPDQGSHYIMIKRNEDDQTIFACVYRNLKSKTLAASCSTSVISGKIRYYKDFNGQQRQLRRPQVFDDNESHKSEYKSRNIY
jgi:hypothetical protein